MKTVRINETGGPEVLSYEDAPDPIPGPGEALVEIKAIGVNFTDVASRRGGTPPEGFPWTPGREAAGVVTAVGEGVSEVSVGDRVGYAMYTGTYAERHAVPSRLLVRLPDDMEFATAAATMIQAMTAHFLVFDIIRLNQGDAALVHAGAGGMGSMLVQMLKRVGAQVFTTVSTEAKAEVARSMGADVVINYTQQDFEEEVQRATGGQGVRIVYDSVGLSTFAKGINCLGRRGYMALYGSASGLIPPVDTTILWNGSLSLTRPTLADFTATREELLRRANEVLDWVATGQLKLNISLNLPLSEAHEAHRQLEGRLTTGKVLLTPEDAGRSHQQTGQRKGWWRRSQTNFRHPSKGLLTLLPALAAAGMLLILTGCSSGSDEEAAPTAAATPTMAATPVAAATPTMAATSIAAATPTLTQEQSTATPTPAVAIDSSDVFFAMDRVLEVEIEIAQEDWDTLRHQTRTFEDVLAEIEEYQLSRPFSDIYTWFSATVTVDDETHTEVGVRKKGFLGSQSDTKPALKLRFDKYVDGQTLGGVMERMTLNNSVQDPSMINTCLTFYVFAAAGSPAPRCNFATVTVNGENLGLYVHVEEIKAPFLARHFDSAEGNLYEGTISDFTPEYRGTIEKKNNGDEDDWSDIEAVVAALQDPSGAGLEELASLVDLDRFLAFWATEALVGHWDGYAGNRNNYWFYREPVGKFVFIPWGVDDTFHLKDDPNVFDHVTEPPPSVLALSAISNRLYNDAEWQAKYVAELKGILDTAWDEEELLGLAASMASIVEEHALSEARPAAAADAERVRQFIMKRRTEILEDLTPEPPEWPDAPPEAGDYGEIEVRFATTWGSNKSFNPFGEGEALYLSVNKEELTLDNIGIISGHASPDETGLLPGMDNLASLAGIALEHDGSIGGFTLVMPIDELKSGAMLVIGKDKIAGGVWSIPAGATEPDSFTIFTEGRLELSEAGTDDGAAISGSFSGTFGGPEGEYQDAAPAEDTANAGLVINEVAAKGDPLDWFELYNASDSHLALANFTVADDLDDPGKRVAFPAGLVLAPGEYMQVEVDKDAWPGFALGSDEELGVWTADGALVDSVDWEEGKSGEGMSYARVPDVTGDFRTVDNPTPGAANQGEN